MIIQAYINKEKFKMDLPSLDVTCEIYNSSAHKRQIKEMEIQLQV